MYSFVLLVAIVGLSSSWVLEIDSHVAPDHTIPLTFAVRVRNEAKLTEHVLDISHPSSPRYGNILTLDEVNDLYSDTDALYALKSYVLNFVEPEAITVFGDFMRVTTGVATAEKILPGSKFHRFVHVPSGTKVVRSLEFDLPADIKEFVDFVGYTTDFPSLAKKAGVRSFVEKSDTDGMIIPQTLIDLYNMPNHRVLSAQSTQCIFESLNQSYAQGDIDMYLRKFGYDTQGMDTVIGPNHPRDCYINGGENCGEANLDAEVILALARGSPTTYWSVPAPGSSEFEPFLEWIMAVSATRNPPLVHSVSYGDVEHDLSPSLMRRFSIEVQKLGLRGVSVLAASMDDGVGNFHSRNGREFCGFNAAFPASDPFVTAVGATQGPEYNLPEVACSSMAGGIITTGGGFSDIFSTPVYQQEAVNGFLKRTNTVGFNSRGRGYPDVSLVGHDYAIILGGKLTSESGTSASTPAFAAMVTHVNAERMVAGKSPLGFLNQVLYGAPSDMYNDITEGENYCAAGRPPKVICCDEGFNSTVGWDPVTGLGTVNYDIMRDYLLSLK